MDDGASVIEKEEAELASLLYPVSEKLRQFHEALSSMVWVSLDSDSLSHLHL